MSVDARPELRRAQRRASYDFNVAAAHLARGAQSDAGRHVLAALIVIHGLGLFVGLPEKVPAPIVVETGLPEIFLFGLAAALLASITNWLGWTLSALVHTHWADDRLLDPDDLGEARPPRGKKRAADAAHLVTLVLSGASALAALCAGYVAIS